MRPFLSTGTGPVVVCNDKISNCNAYDKQVCTEPQYAVWAEDHCANFCSMCTGKTTWDTFYDDHMYM